MRLRDTVCLVFIAALLVGCKGQGFTFNVTATTSGRNITVGIAEASGTATFECQLDSGAFQPCFDGFVYVSVPIGNRSITVRGTSQDNQTSTVTIGPLQIFSELTVTSTVSGDGTVITVIIDANQDATFECQLDDASFIPCFSGFQYRGVSAGPHTVRVRATSTATGVIALSNIGTVNIDQLAIQFEGITGTQDISAQTYTFEFTPTEDFPVECSIDGGEFVNCTSPYVIDTSLLSRGEHNITFRIVIDGVVRGLATETFTVLEEVIIEFREATYSVVEDNRAYTFTVVRQGEPGEDIVVSIFPSPDSRPGAIDPVEFPSDFTQGGQVTFTPGGPSEITSQLLVQNDSTLEANETILLALSLNPAAMESGARLGARNQSVVTVINDDVVEVMFQQQLVEADETTQARFSVTFSPQDTEIPFTFIVETVDLSPPDAQAGVDYEPLRMNVTLGPLQATQNLAVDIIEDSLTERTEEFQVRIIVPEEAQQLGVSLGMPSVLTVRIIDDDPGDPEIECSTNVTGDELTGRTIRITFSANQDDVTFRCRLNNEAFVSCTSPFEFMNVDFFETVTVTLEATTLLFDTATVTKPVFFAMGGLQVVGAGAIAVDLSATKNATYRCRLNDGEFVDCVDGQVFSNLAAGRYTLFIEATATDGSNDVAFDTVGPVLLAAGANATISEAIAACFGRAELRCDNVTCQYVATWRSRGDMVEFSLVARTQGWVGIGFSTNRIMPRSDIIVGAADDDVSFFVDDRYAANRVQPPPDAIQNINSGSASFVNGITTVEFSRNKVTNDSEDDLSLNVCRYLLYAWSGDANINTRVIQFHGTQNQGVSETLLCFPSPSLCPERFDCGDPGTPADGSRNLTDTMEGSIVTYSCNTGFELVGNSSRLCELTADGPRWSFTTPECISIRCEDPGEPINGGTTVSSFSVGSTAIHFCNEGFILDGVSQRTCLENGTFSDSLPTCVIVDCGEPGTPTNGNTMGTLINITSTDVVTLALSTTFGSLVNHTCDEGFRLIGATLRECLANGNWSAPLPTCELIDCGNLLAPDNGDIMITTTTLESLANYTCNTGFRLDGVDQRVCLSNGSWSDDAPSCIIVDCGDAGTPANGGTMQTTTTFGSIVNHTCNEGFNLTGADQRECLANGSWSAPLPTCVIIDCGDAGTPANGDTMQTNTTFGSIVNHTCDEGYNLIGESQRICLATGMWSAPLPSCMIVDCGNPGTPINGNTMVESTTFGAVVTHTCNTGFALNGTSLRECLADGNWSQPLPSCILSNCGDPGTPGNGSTIGESFTFGSTINHTCNEGFEIIGASQRICLENSSWSDSLPICRIIDCGDPGIPDNGTTTGTSTTFGSIVMHVCNEGFLLVGEDRRECLQNGSWSAPLPMCNEVNCGDPGVPANGDTAVSSTTLNSVALHTCDDGFVLVGESERVCLENGGWSAPLPSCEESRICQIDGLSISPYSQTGSVISYLLRDVCEHTVLTTCTGSERFSVNVDYSEESLNLARVGVRYNSTTIIVITDDNGLSLISQNLGNIISQSGQTTEYPNQIFITQASNEIIIDLRRLGVRLNVSSSGLQVEVTSGALSGDVCGLCGRLNGELLYSDRTSVADITDRVDIQQFTNSWRADDVFLRDAPRNICSSTVKIGDPLFKIPIHFDQALIDQNPALAEACLCYEVHGRDNSTFNLLSDRCTSVNAQYTAMANPVAGNFISAIGVTAIDRDGVCHQIEASIDQCSVMVDGNPLDVGETFSNAGITVMRFQGRVKIVAPNCGRVEVVLWFICKAIKNTVMSEFIIARGVTLQPTSHGLVGQFWNIPVGIEDFAVNSSVSPFYAVTINAPDRAPRSFVGSLFERPWEVMLPCLFSGNRQGGATNAFSDPNDSIIQGSIGDYEVDDLFANDFAFSTFNSAACAKKK